MRKKVTSNIIRRIVELYQQGSGTVRISRQLNLSITTIRKYLLRVGVKFRTAPKDVISSEQHKKFVRLYKQGLSMERKAEALNKLLASYKVWQRTQKEVDKLMPEMLQMKEEGLSYSDIGRAISLPIGTVWGRLNHEKAGKVIK